MRFIFYVNVNNNINNKNIITLYVDVDMYFKEIKGENILFGKIWWS